MRDGPDTGIVFQQSVTEVKYRAFALSAISTRPEMLLSSFVPIRTARNWDDRLRKKCRDWDSSRSRSGRDSFGNADHICFDITELVAMLAATHLNDTALELKS